MKSKLVFILVALVFACCSAIDQQESRSNIFARRKPADAAFDNEALKLEPGREVDASNAGFDIFENIAVEQRRNLKGLRRGASLIQSNMVRPKKLAIKGLKQDDPKNNVKLEINPKPVELSPCDDDLEANMFDQAMSMPLNETPTPQPSISLKQMTPETNQPTLSQTKSPAASPQTPTTKTPTALAPISSFPTQTSATPIVLPTAVPLPEPSAVPSAVPTSTPTTVAPITAAPVTKTPTKQPTRKPITSAPTKTLCDPPLSIRQRQSELLEILTEISPEDLILTVGSSQNKAFTWLIGEDTAVVCPENKLEVIQRYIMAVNYFSLGGDEWRVCRRANVTTEPCVNGEPHLSSANVCDWFNVTCNSDDNRITSIILDTNNLNGTLPSEFGSLNSLERIGFNNNPAIFGSIPISYGFIEALKVLDLNSSALTGVLPSSLCLAAQLERLDVLMNTLNGTIPSCIGMLVSLNTLALDKNMLSGSLPSEIGTMTSLEYLTINDNALDGTLPTELGSNSAFKVISLQQNSLNGTLPSSLGALTAIETLNFFSNQLVGSVPTELGNLFRMENLFLHFNALTGTMPESICALRADRGVGRIQQLTADCGPRGAIVCECCTACF